MRRLEEWSHIHRKMEDRTRLTDPLAFSLRRTPYVCVKVYIPKQLCSVVRIRHFSKGESLCPLLRVPSI